MTAAAVGVGGLALWRGHPARRCPALCVHRAAAYPSSQVHLSSPLRLSVRAYSERERRAGGVGEEAPNLPSRLAVPMKDFSE